MSPTTVATQAELDQAITDGAESIEIRSGRGVWLTIGDTRDSHISVAGSSQIDTCSGRVDRVTDSGRVGWVTGSGSVGEVTDSGSVELQQSVIELYREMTLVGRTAVAS